MRRSAAVAAMTWVWVATGGAVGALARYGLTLVLQPAAGSRLPWGTLAANLLGCFLLGVLTELAVASGRLSPDLRAGLGVGFLGSLTTFSTFAFETWHGLDRGDWLGAAGNLLLNLVGGLLLVVLGVAAARALLGR